MKGKFTVQHFFKEILKSYIQGFIQVIKYDFLVFNV